MLLKYLRDGLPPVSDFESDSDEENSNPRCFENILSSMVTLAGAGVSVKLKNFENLSYFEFESKRGVHRIRPISPFTSPTSDPVIEKMLDDPDDWEEFELAEDLDEDQEDWYYIYPHLKRNISSIMARINNALQTEFDY